MKILLVFTLCLISDGGASNEVTGYSGGGVLIKCKYKTLYTQNSKYFCKISQTSCSDQIKTQTKNQWVNSGRFSLFDTRSAEFWVMIRELTVQDTGTYQCGVDLPWHTDIYTPVVLNVKKDESYEKSISKTVHVGEDLTLSCKYPESLKSYPKSLCKKPQTAAWFYKECVKESKEDINKGKFFLYDDRAKHILNMTGKNVTETDSGEYWCGAEASDQGYKVYFTQINLRVTALPSETTQSSAVSSSSSSSSSSSTSTSSLLSSSSSLSLSPTPTTARTGLSPVSIVITVLANILIGLLIGNACFFVILRIKRKKQGRSASLERNVVPDSGNSHEDYKDTKGLFALEAGTSTSPSDPSKSIYANIVLSPSPSNSASTASVAKLPRKLTDSPTSAVETSAEGLTYATVCFRSNATSADDAAPKMTFNKKEESCEYATVSRGYI